ncbi:MAG: histidine phosphatase family protein [Proteobacteria bacterium]|nr:histidine phosphatase family protein [Pseudomonadota bacterium]
MKTILLLRHAKSAWGEPGLSDHDRPLNRRGEVAAAAIADHLVAKGIVPDLILCSTATRARQTLAPLIERLPAPAPPIALESGLYLASEDMLLNRLRDLPDATGTVLLIGHNDGLGLLAQALAGSGKASLLAALRDKYPTGALATLQADIAAWPKLKPGIATLAAFTCPRDLD